MNRTRVVVPTGGPDLTAPHFDDEATIVRARPVVPIARAKVVARSRMSVLILIGLLAAAVSGAAGAFGVNYYENRSRAALTSTAESQIKQEPQTNQPPASEPQSVAPALATKDHDAQGGLDASVAPESASPEVETAKPQTEAEVADKKDDSRTDQNVPAASNARVTRTLPSPAKPVRSARPDYRNTRASYDPDRIVRPRRVHPTSVRTVPAPSARTKNKRPVNKRNRGAGRIPEIFEGPNPR